MSLRRRGVSVNSGVVIDYIMTTQSNSEIFEICLAKGWCQAAGMTTADAARVTDVSNYFYNKTNITHFEEFEYFTGVTALSTGAFRNTANLTSICLPANLTTIGDRAFQESGITTIDFSNVTILGETVCSGCTSLVSAIVGENITALPKSTFSGCTALESIKILNNQEVVTMGTNALYNVSKTDCTIYVPSNMVAAYQADTGWNGYDIQAIPVAE